MKILVMLFCADANQLLVSEHIQNELQKYGSSCDVKDLVYYSFDNRASDELAYISGLYDDLNCGEYGAVVFLHSYPAKLFLRIKKLKNIKTYSCIVQSDFSLHFSYFKLDVDKFYVPHEILGGEYEEHGIPSSKISVFGIPSLDLQFCDKIQENNDIFCLIFADGYDISEVLDITQKSEDFCFEAAFAVVSLNCDQYRAYGRLFDGYNNVNVFGTEDIECFCCLRKPDVIIINSSNVNVYSAMKCGFPIILFDDGSKIESESFSFLTHIECCVPCKSIDEVIEALKCRFYNAGLGAFLSNNCRNNVIENSAQKICEDIISFNNKYDNYEKR